MVDIENALPGMQDCAGAACDLWSLYYFRISRQKSVEDDQLC
jgi:hypothetical protein